MSRSTKIYAAIAAALVVLLTIIGVWAFRASSHNSTVSAQLDALNAVEKSLDADADAQGVIAAIVSLRAEYERLKEQGVTDEAKSRFEEILASLTDRVAEGYEAAFVESEIPNLATMSDELKIRDAINQLRELLTQVEADAADLDALGITKKYTGKINERIFEYEARLSAIAEEKRQAEDEAKKKAEEEAKRQAEEEAKRQAEEEAKRKAEEEAARAASHYENDHFTLDFPEEWAGKWSVDRVGNSTINPSYQITVEGIDDPAGGGAQTLHVVCALANVEGDTLKHLGTTYGTVCKVYKHHDWGMGLLNDNQSKGPVKLKLK